MTITTQPPARPFDSQMDANPFTPAQGLMIILGTQAGREIIIDVSDADRMVLHSRRMVVISQLRADGGEAGHMPA